MKYLLITILFLSSSCTHAFLDVHEAEVLYWYEIENDEHRYYYNIVNNSSSAEIVKVIVGYQYDDDGGIPKLFAPAGDRTHIPLDFISPEGWSGDLRYVEESLEYSLGWVTSDPTKFDISANSSSYEFGVILSNQRDDHINSYFSVIFNDGTVTTRKMDAETNSPPRNPILTPLYELLLSKGIEPRVMQMASKY